MRIDVTSEATASCGIVTTVARGNEAHATAEVRSPGLPAVPRRASSRSTISTVTSGASTTVVSTPWPESTPSLAAANSGASRSTGAKRHSSSRPFGTGKSATSNDVGREARDDSGVPPRPWVCAPSAVAREWSVDKGSVVVVISRRILPSAAR